jgi:hypothetical protein
MGQISCTSPAAQHKLVCEFPFATGALANTSALGTGQQSSQFSAQAVATGINTAVATRVSQLPLASASAGALLIYTHGGQVLETINDLGPILTDRAETIGLHKFFIGSTWSQFVFTDIDSNPLSALPWTYSQSAYDSTGKLVDTIYTTEKVKLSFRLNQDVSVATFGLRKNLDISVIVPFDRVAMGTWTVGPSGKTSTGPESFVVSNNTLVFSYQVKPIYAAGTASGLGDITFNVKRSLAAGERDSVAVAGNVRVPTGDERNFLGSGSWGMSPYLVYSHSGKLAPHLKVGYQWNTSSDLNHAPGSTHGDQRLPGGVFYDAGLDWAAKKKLTLVADLLGSQFQNVQKLLAQQISVIGVPANQLSQTTGTSLFTYTISNVSTGFKLAPMRNLTLSANLLTQINNVGLRSRPTPMAGISYMF